MEYFSNYVRIDLDILKKNLQSIKKRVNADILMVVKADAYGHGAVPVAKHLEEECAFFGVAAVSEALELYKAGIRKPILMLGHTPVSAFPEVVRLGIRPAIFRYEDALALSEEAQKQGVTAPFHFALDTGMSRIGFQATADEAALCAKIAGLPNLYAEGLFTHFYAADTEDPTAMERQHQLFCDFDHMLQEYGVCVPVRHVENSAAMVTLGQHYEMVRAGIIAYGLDPSDVVHSQKLETLPCLQWRSHVTHVKPLEPGRVISYGATYTVERPSIIATVPVGYADGYRWNLYNRFHVLINGKPAPIRGRICMDQLMVDVTDIPNVKPGDEVTLLGSDGSYTISAEEMATASGTINYDIICGLSRRVPRVYVENGQITQTVDYLL